MNKDDFNERDYIHGKKNYYWHATDDCCIKDYESNMCEEYHCNSKCKECYTGATGANGCSGARGATGVTGATGATGTDGFETQLRGMQFQLQDQQIESVDSGDTVIFDTIISDLSSFISYNDKTGEITITQTGVFYINWWVAINTGLGADESFTFAIISSANDRIQASAPSLQAIQINGNALISITASEKSPVTLKLVNLNNGTVGFGVAPIRADLTIISVTF